MPLPNFHSARVKSPTAFKMLPGKKGKFRTKRIAKDWLKKHKVSFTSFEKAKVAPKKKNETISLSDLADTLRDKLGEAV